MGMAKEHTLNIYGHNSIYTQDYLKNNYGKRKLKIHFCEPDFGTNGDTGILLFISGFGANSNSNVYKKMRQTFANKYNLVTIQCDYFGNEFMQKANNVLLNINRNEIEKIFTSNEIEYIFEEGNTNLNRLLEVGKNYNITMHGRENLSNENHMNFNDMGIMQALDNITSVIYVMSILYNNNHKFNSKKIILYGHSHGAYLSYLCNALAPHLFSLLIDNSAWLFPVYLKDNRVVFNKIGKMKLAIEFDYFAKNINFDEELLNLSTLYGKLGNNCNIISYHGNNDNLINNKIKENFCSKLDYCIYNEISEKNIDGVIFKSNAHGLGADFLNLFDYTIKDLEKLNFKFGKDSSFYLPNLEISTNQNNYMINYDNLFPEFRII